MTRARPGIRKPPKSRPALIQQRELHALMHPPVRSPLPPLCAEFDAIMADLSPPLIDRFSAWVRSLGSRLMRFRAVPKART
jgi:hypothetical protein